MLVNVHALKIYHYDHIVNIFQNNLLDERMKGFNHFNEKSFH